MQSRLAFYTALIKTEIAILLPLDKIEGVSGYGYGSLARILHIVSVLFITQ